MNFQKQFDTITGALNIFDMSYLVSGAAMMTVLVYTFPGYRDFIFHYNQVTLSVFVCIVITYILGMICWVAGKQIRYWCINSHEDTVKVNYTNLYRIAEKLKICQQFDYKSVHGRSSDKTLILGINDDVDVVPNFEFTYKTFSPYYQSVPLRFDLEEADEVVIFGLAMGDIDYPYFQDFFRHICNPKNSRDDRKRVAIFTYDENSRMSILRRLRAMNEKRVNYMFGQNEFEFIRTSEPNDELKFARFLRRLEKEINL